MNLSRKNIVFDWIIHPIARTAILAWGVLLGNLAVAAPVSSEGYDLVDLTDTIGS